MPSDSLLPVRQGRLWFITSGETYPRRSYYLDPQQSAWLDSLQRATSPVFTARDGVTEVYCLNCLPGTLE
jgi:hypothetical protein